MRKEDLIAGLSVAGLMLPEAVAYAGIAGLPPQRAIFAGIAGCLAYAIVGRSRFAIVSPTSSSAAILAATLAAMPGSVAEKMTLASIVVGLTGILFLLAAAARLGSFTGFISRPVLRGFAFGLAITIIVRQLPILLGSPATGADIFRLAAHLVTGIAGWTPASVATGGVALVALLLLRRFPAIPGAFLVLVAGIAASYFLALPHHGVAVVGTIDMIPAWPALPSLGWQDYSRLGQFTLPLVLILFAESWGTIRALALRHGDPVDADRELGALGVANIASMVVQGMPVGAGFSAGAASEAAGAATRATGIVAAIGLALLIAVAAPLIAQLPQPVLAAVVIAALTHALDPTPLVRLWRLDRDQYVALGAAAGVLVLGVLNGMLVAILLSLVALLRRLATPLVARLGRLGQTHDYVDLARHPDAVAPAGIAVWRPTTPLFFANAERVLAYIAIKTRGNAATRAIVVSLEESFDLDSTALDALIEFDTTMQAAGIRVQLARVHDRARDLLAASDATDLQTRSSYSVDDAVAALEPPVPRMETLP
jgi:MFS superfamily sulfate permease-like transporter